MAGELPEVTSYQSALVALVITDGEGTDHPDVLAVCENFSAERRFDTELQKVIGSFYPINALVHGSEGSFSWGGAVSSTDLTNVKIIPNAANLGTWRPFSIKVIDLITNELLCMLEKGAINADTKNMSAATKFMSNVQGVCCRVYDPSELN